jgi:hypothetical protein
MDRLQEMKVAEALNYAIWLRDNVNELGDFDLTECIQALGKFDIFSSRQISAIVDGKVPHGKITKLIGKTDKTGGNLNVGTLDILRNILLTRADDGTDYKLIASAVGMGTSQGMVAKLTGVPQGTISKKLRRK